VHFTHSTENTQVRLTDGNTIFTPNLFGPGIEVNEVRYQMASLDAGIKYRGYALEAEYYWRHLSDFVGPGVTPGLIADIDDTGYQVQASAMLLPKLLQVYGDSNELRLDDIPVGYTAVPYPVGGNGDVFHLNFELNF